MPPWTLALKPVNFLSMMKLTTPAIASEPQEAEAPPVTTSTRWIRSCGSSLTSVMPVHVGRHDALAVDQGQGADGAQAPHGEG